MIEEFKGRYAFLSNFGSGGRWTVEHRFQAAKATTPEDRTAILNCPTPATAKRMGRAVILRPNWGEIKDEIMLALLREKFAPGTDYAKWLLETGEQELLEGNRWGDRYWGVDLTTGEGQNVLGNLLMQVRRELRG